MTIRYELIIYWSDEDQSFIVEVPELPGCAADGETYQEAVQNVEVIIQEWIEQPRASIARFPNPKVGRSQCKCFAPTTHAPTYAPHPPYAL